MTGHSWISENEMGGCCGYWLPLMTAVLMMTALSCGSSRTVQDESLAVKNMPLLLAVGADAVVRHDERLFEVTESNRGRLHIRRSVTVMNRDGRAQARVTIPYNPYRVPGNFKGEVYDRNGQRVRTLRRSDIEDHALVTQINWYTDYRYKRFQLMHDEYPYTVTYSYTIDYNNLLNWPEWTPQRRGTSVEYAQFVLRVAEGVRFRTRESNLESTGEEMSGRSIIHSDIPAAAVTADGLREYRWEIRNRYPISTTRGGPDYAELQPELRISGSDFEVDGYAGSLRTWEDFAGWYRRLYSENMELSGRDRELVREITATSSDTLEIIRRLYRHVQEYTRYVNVSLGIGGWKPFPPIYVYENRHGECKALTHYLFVLLREAGIPSCPVLVQSRPGRSTVDPDFPENAFNHVFLAVPYPVSGIGETVEPDGTGGSGGNGGHGSSISSGGTDGTGGSENTSTRNICTDAHYQAGNFLWMEATSSTLPAGYAGRSNSDRYGLLITEDGGGMIRIPGLGSDVNRLARSGVFDIDENGNIQGILQVLASGYPHEQVRKAGHFMNTRDQRQFLDSRITWPRSRIGEFEIHSDPLLPQAGYEVQLEQPGFASRSGNRLFVTAPRPVRGHPRLPDEDQEPVDADSEQDTDLDREPVLEPVEGSGQGSGPEQDTDLDPAQNVQPVFRLDMAYSTSDSLVFRIPEGFRVEALPETWYLHTETASGRSEWRLDDTPQQPVVIMTTHLSIRQDEFREDDLRQLRNVLQGLGQQARRPLVLVREDGS